MQEVPQNPSAEDAGTIETHVDSAGKVWVPKDAYDEAKSDGQLGWDMWGVSLESRQAERQEEQQVEALADAAEDVSESTVDFVGGIPFVGEDIGDALREGYDVVEDAVDHADDPVVEDVDPWG